jgi:hypothetical protein
VKADRACLSTACMQCSGGFKCLHRLKLRSAYLGFLKLRVWPEVPSSECIYSQQCKSRCTRRAEASQQGLNSSGEHKSVVTPSKGHNVHTLSSSAISGDLDTLQLLDNVCRGKSKIQQNDLKVKIL